MRVADRLRAETGIYELRLDSVWGYKRHDDVVLAFAREDEGN